FKCLTAEVRLMARTIARLGILALLLAAGGYYYYLHARPTALVLTGIVTTNDTIVSAQVPGQIGRLLVSEGDAVKKGQLLAELTLDELRADSAYFAQAAEGAGSAVRESESALKFQERQTDAQVRQAEATLASAEAAYQSGQADTERLRLAFERA